MQIRFSQHALQRIKQRLISKKSVTQAITQPTIILDTYRGRVIYQKAHNSAVLEVVTKHEDDIIIVITCYFLSR